MGSNYKGLDKLVFQNVAVGRMNRVVTFTEVSYKIMYQRFAATKRNGLNNEMTLLTRWP